MNVATELRQAFRLRHVYQPMNVASELRQVFHLTQLHGYMHLLQA